LDIIKAFQRDVYTLIICSCVKTRVFINGKMSPDAYCAIADYPEKAMHSMMNPLLSMRLDSQHYLKRKSCSSEWCASWRDLDRPAYVVDYVFDQFASKSKKRNNWTCSLITQPSHIPQRNSWPVTLDQKYPDHFACVYFNAKSYYQQVHVDISNDFYGVQLTARQFFEAFEKEMCRKVFPTVGLAPV